MAAAPLSACVAIDFGTAATGYAIALPGATSNPAAARVLPFKPGDRGSAATEKNATCILLDASTMRVLSFGFDARRTFFQMDPAEMQRHIFLQQFKMAMAPQAQGGKELSQRTVLGEGANMPVLLRTAVAKVLEFIRLEASDRAASIGLPAPEKLSWVITVPAIWSEEAKYFMRSAAVEAGLIPDANSNRLALALEPEGAVIASALEAPEEVKARLTVGQRLLIVDAGGGRWTAQ
jgi:molecular chaperone DnaK (HSP70)